MESIVTALLSLTFSGGPHAVSAILLLFIVIILIDRRRLLENIAKKEARLDEIVEDYYKGNMTLAEAMTSLKSVLFEIKMKL